ncbi:hypothetical protein BASA81_002112 [Batrachochytrium salamandrivorans]|nr:hypothetical protein BASA81_002112 [Batrachochytrium salamandrivorans]
MLSLVGARSVFAKSLAGVFFLAFLSSFWQWPALHSATHGLVPISDFPELGLFLVHVAGMALSLSIALGLISSNPMCLLPLGYWWLTHLSRRSGAPFFNYQWDNLLVEAGVVGSLWCIQSVDSPPRSVLWALRFLAFKLMFMSGAVKVLSNDPVWLDMTAVKYHLASQPLPTPLAYWLSQYAPDWLQRGMAALALWVELPVAVLLIFPPVASWPRQFAAVLTLGLMAGIALTGNYNILNLLTMVLMIPCLVGKDEVAFGCLPRQGVLSLLALLGLGYYTSMILFDFSAEEGGLELRITPLELTRQIEVLLPLACALVLTCALAGWVWDLAQCWSEDVASFHVAWGLGVLAIGFVLLSATPMFYSLHPQPQAFVPGKIVEAHHRFGKEFTSSYGLFRSVTGVGPNREIAVPAIHLVATFDGHEQEEELAFCYYHQVAFVAPHQPRLDWQLWFAALGPEYAIRQPWFRNLVDKLFEHEPLVLQQLSPQSSTTMSSKSVESIRVEVSSYRFPQSDSSGGDGKWWQPSSSRRVVASVNRPEAKRRVKKGQVLSLWVNHATELAVAIALVLISLRWWLA